VLVTTMNDRPGSAIDEVLGELCGELGSSWTETCADGSAGVATKV